MKEAGLEGKVATFSQEQRVRGKQGATAAWLQRRMQQQTTGYAITAKPSANLYILLQVGIAHVHMHEAQIQLLDALAGMFFCNAHACQDDLSIASEICRCRSRRSCRLGGMQLILVLESSALQVRPALKQSCSMSTEVT